MLDTSESQQDPRVTRPLDEFYLERYYLTRSEPIPHLLNMSLEPLRNINDAPPQLLEESVKSRYVYKLCLDLSVLPAAEFFLYPINTHHPDYDRYVECVTHPMYLDYIIKGLKAQKDPISSLRAIQYLSLIFTNAYLVYQPSQPEYQAAHYLQYRTVRRLVRTAVFTPEEIRFVAQKCNWKEFRYVDAEAPQIQSQSKFTWPIPPDLDEVLPRYEGDNIPLTWEERNRFTCFLQVIPPKIFDFWNENMHRLASNIIPVLKPRYTPALDLDDLDTIVQRHMLKNFDDLLESTSQPS
ncbi:hypothetical protein BLNAU_2753 [Blattamonas nauphoetae]|uniref:Bromo domain-containing protein n=1 Tax=Blattamonas nauphoetae TaxID=2049346 RepID=A0ABQ9YEH2_9EUKA|nr:hypothetical protein BLNAU_2753 [Blattamonas nauphoetae]